MGSRIEWARGVPRAAGGLQRIGRRGVVWWIALAFAWQVPVAALAQDFPATQVLDRFNRTDEGSPPDERWVDARGLPGQIGLVVVDEQATGFDTNSSHSSSWLDGFAEDQEAFVTLVEVPGLNAGPEVAVRMKDPADKLSTQYSAIWHSRIGVDNDEVQIWKRVGSSLTGFVDTCLYCTGNIGTDLLPGDQIGVRVVDATITVYLNGTLVGEVDDVTDPITGPGHLNLYAGDDVGMVFDDFGGGGVFALSCEDGLDNDGDGLIDEADPGCGPADPDDESPQCDDGVDNDGDGGIDWDGAGIGPADEHCLPTPWRIREVKRQCGLGAELGVVLVGLWAVPALRRRRRVARA